MDGRHHVVMQAYLHVDATELLQRLLERELAPVDLRAGLFLHRLGDVGRGHRAEKAALASGSRLDGDRASLELRGKGLRALALASLACLAIAPHRVRLLLTSRRCLQREPARNDIVARVA